MSYSITHIEGISVVRDSKGQAVCTARDKDDAERIAHALSVFDVITDDYAELMFEDWTEISKIDLNEFALQIQGALMEVNPPDGV